MKGRKVIIDVQDVAKIFVTAKRRIVALEKTDLSIYEGEFLCLVGPSGCGKTTLLNIIAGLTPPTEGKVFMDGKEIQGPSTERGFVFQDDAVFPWMTVKDNILYGPRQQGVPSHECKKILNNVISLIGLEGFEDSYPKELSGGMKKRVDLGRTYASNPEVFLMDEPFGALDAFTKEKLQIELIRLLRKTSKKTVIFVTHDLEEAIFLGDRVAVMTPRPGKIKTVVEIPFGDKERTSELKTDSRFQQLRRKISSLFYEE